MGALGFIAGIVAGLVAGLACVALLPGIAGIVAGVVVGAAAYVGVSLLFARERRLRGRAVSEIPEGEKAAAAIDEARTAADSVAQLAAQVADAGIRAQASGFVEATRALIRYTEDNPESFRVLRRFSSTYSEQATRLLDTYLDIERAGATTELAGARAETLDAFALLEKTAAGELSRAVSSDALSLAASAAAIDKLASMDGYSADGAGSAGAGAGAGAPRRHTSAEVPAMPMGELRGAAASGAAATATPSAPAPQPAPAPVPSRPAARPADAPSSAPGPAAPTSPSGKERA